VLALGRAQNVGTNYIADCSLPVRLSLAGPNERGLFRGEIERQLYVHGLNWNRGQEIKLDTNNRPPDKLFEFVRVLISSRSSGSAS